MAFLSLRVHNVRGQYIPLLSIDEVTKGDNHVIAYQRVEVKTHGVGALSMDDSRGLTIYCRSRRWPQSGRVIQVQAHRFN